MRRSPLRRSASPIIRKTPLRRVSVKRRQESRERRDVVARVLARDGGCVIRGIVLSPCSGPLDVDEIVSRGRGGSFLDDENCQTLCRAHHDRKHSHIHAASILGLWGEHAREIHVHQELGDAPPLDDLFDLGIWARDVFDR